MNPHARRRTSRAPVRMRCTLTRRKGAPVPACTLDLGPGGMSVQTERPLSVDEVLNFDLPLEGSHAIGVARVVRQQGLDVYALRFEGIGPDAADRIASLNEPV